MKEFSLVVIAQPTELENLWISEFMRSPAFNCPLIVVGNHVWGENLNGWITRKKNIGVELTSTEYCLVCHADTYPTEGFFEALQDIEVEDDEVLCPKGVLPDGRTGLTWAQTGHHDPSPVYIPGESYISGAAIFAKTHTFLLLPWNEQLEWGQGEDVDYSRMLEASGVIQRFEPRLIVNMRNTQ